MAKGQLPSKAIVGGTESGQLLYLCRARYKNGLQPGKVVGNNYNLG